MLIILTAFAVMLLCLLLQAVFVATCLRRYKRFRWTYRHTESRLEDIALLAMVMLLMMLGILVQIAIWGTVFVLIGEFDDFTTAFYHSGVNFAGLGYGDIVMSERWRPLGPLEAANGIMMFGVATAVMTAAVMEIVKSKLGLRKGDGSQGPNSG
ncbi:MAG: ion channel [Allosphingosinicella sp.]